MLPMHQYQSHSTVLNYNSFQTTSMPNYMFKQFQQPNQINCPQQTQTQLQQCTLDDHMFKCYLHWYLLPVKEIQKEKKQLEDLAHKYNVVMCLWRIVTQDGRRFQMIDIKGIKQLSKLQQFLDQALNVSHPTYINKKFKVLSICIINNYGSFQAQKCYSLCKNCNDEQRLNECCAQFICAKCSKGQNKCPYCSKKLEVVRIPFEIVEVQQLRRIYQPMFSELGVEERFELMDMIQGDFDYN